MYDELIKRLRDSEHEIDCSLCDRDCCYPDGKVHGKCIIIEAFDAIEELSVVVRAQKAVLEKFPRWIPVTERLPEEYETVLLLPMSGEVISGYYDSEHKSYCDMTGFRHLCTHWMPLPEQPKEETE